MAYGNALNVLTSASSRLDFRRYRSEDICKLLQLKTQERKQLIPREEFNFV